MCSTRVLSFTCQHSDHIAHYTLQRLSRVPAREVGLGPQSKRRDPQNTRCHTRRKLTDWICNFVAKRKIVSELKMLEKSLNIDWLNWFSSGVGKWSWKELDAEWLLWHHKWKFMLFRIISVFSVLARIIAKWFIMWIWVYWMRENLCIVVCCWCVCCIENKWKVWKWQVKAIAESKRRKRSKMEGWKEGQSRWKTGELTKDCPERITKCVREREWELNSPLFSTYITLSLSYSLCPLFLVPCSLWWVLRIVFSGESWITGSALLVGELSSFLPLPSSSPLSLSCQSLKSCESSQSPQPFAQGYRRVLRRIKQQLCQVPRR